MEEIKAIFTYVLFLIQISFAQKSFLSHATYPMNRIYDSNRNIFLNVSQNQSDLHDFICVEIITHSIRHQNDTICIFGNKKT